MWHRSAADAGDGPLQPPYVTLRPGRGQLYRRTGLSAACRAVATGQGLRCRGRGLKEPLTLAQFVGR